MDSVTLKAAHEFSLLKVIVIIRKHFQAPDSSIQVTLKRSHTPRCFIIGVGGSFGNTCSWCTSGWAAPWVQLLGTVFQWNTWEFMLPAAEVGSLSGTAKNHTKSSEERTFAKICNYKRRICKFSRQERRISMMLSVKISLEEWSFSLKSFWKNEAFCWNLS